MADPRRRTVLVTGASSGIGEATALRLDRGGWRVFAGVRREEDAERLRAGSGGSLTSLLLDVTDAGGIEAAAAAVGERLDGLVNNAGIAIASPLETLPLAELRLQLEVNLVGQVVVTQAFLPALRSAQGRLVFVGSIGGRSALPFLSAYAASKFALEGIADALRVELMPFGIEVSVVEPGSIATPIWTKGGEAAARLAESWPQELSLLYRDRLASFRAAAAARREVPAEDAAAAIEHALTARRPRTRYVVGPDARRRARLQRLPDRWRDRILARVLFGGDRRP